MKAALTVRGLSVRYDGLRALEDVSVSVYAGMVTGLIGPNGAGKTTFVDAITGHTPATADEVSLSGRDVRSWSPSRRARRGLVRTFQSVDLFDDLTVADNVRVAIERRTTFGHLADFVAPGRGSMVVDDAVAALLQRFGLARVASSRPTELSHGDRQMVSLARSVAARPCVLLLDEPAAGLSSVESRELAVRLDDLRADGLAVLLIEHDIELVMRVCDQLYVLDRGALIAAGPPDVVRLDPRVRAAYLGEPTEEEL